MRLKDGSILTNGMRFATPINGHQLETIRALEGSRTRFSVVPYHSIAAAFTDGKIDDWSRVRGINISDLQNGSGCCGFERP